jgi:hypothetical protein
MLEIHIREEQQKITIKFSQPQEMYSIWLVFLKAEKQGLVILIFACLVKMKHLDVYYH